MPRRFIRELNHQEAVDAVFVASEKQLRPNRNGNLYLQVNLSDRTGSIAARIWNAGEAVYQSFDDGDHVRVVGTAQLYQGAMQIVASKIFRANPAEVDPADFTPVAAIDVDRFMLRLAEMLRGLGDPALKNLAECFLIDEPLLSKLAMAPAGSKNHHAYHGGLLEHVVGLMELVLRVAPCYPQIDRDLLLMGAFLHDLGKTDELSYAHGLGYTDEGQLIGHLVMAVELLDAKLAEAERLSGEPVPHETALRLKHMILSHHGQYAFGSPKLPMTLEAVALAHLDNLDAKINTFSSLMEEDPNIDSPWTLYHANLERKLFKGTRGEGQGTRDEG